MNPDDELKTEVRAFIVQNFLFGVEEDLGDDTSFLDRGILLGFKVSSQHRVV